MIKKLSLHIVTFATVLFSLSPAFGTSDKCADALIGGSSDNQQFDTADYTTYITTLLERNYDTWFTDGIPEGYQENEVFKLTAALKNSVRITWPKKVAFVDTYDLMEMEKHQNDALERMLKLVDLLESDELLSNPVIRSGLIQIIDQLSRNEEYLLNSTWSGSLVDPWLKWKGQYQILRYGIGTYKTRKAFKALKEELLLPP